MSHRRFDPALALSALAAMAALVVSLFVHGELAGRDRQERRDSAGATADLVAARFQGRLRGVLLTLETAAAAAPDELGDRTATLRARGAVTAVGRVTADGRTPTSVIGESGALHPVPDATLNAARDSAHAGLDRAVGGTELVGVAPVYRAVPASTVDRRALLAGYVVATIDAGRLIEDSLPDDAPAAVRLTDNTDAIATVGTAPGRGPRAGRLVEAGGQAYLLSLRLPPVPARFPALPLTGAALAALIAGSGAATVLGRRRAERAASERSEELSLLANLGALLQDSLDLEVILPAAALRLSEQLDLDGFAVLRVDRRGRLVHAFSLGATPVGEFTAAAVRPFGDVVPAGTEALFPLQPAGRVTGALWLRPRRTLEGASVRSVQAAADLLASAMANADAFDQERESVRRLEDLDRIKNRFIGTVSHEMRTSASAISGFANLLASRWDHLDDEERRDLVVRIDRNGQSLVSVVEDFLDFSRLERRSPASDPPPASLSDLVAIAVEDVTALAPRHRIVSRIAPGVMAFVDQGAIERILTNLVSNAAKYSPAGSQITITVEAAGDAAVLAVDDEGSGIPPAERERVFDAFYRAAHDVVGGTHGAGIGLAVVKEVVDRLRARVTVEDSLAGGARLVVSFRAVSAPARSSLLTGVSDGQ